MEDHPCNNADSGVHQKQAASSSFPFRGSHHRRAHSEVNFRLPPELDLVSEPFDPHPSGSFEEMGSEDDLFCTYMDMEKLGSATAANINSGHNNNNNVNANGGAPDQHHLLHRIENSHNNDNDEVDDKNNVKGGGRHRHSNSVDGSSILDSIEAKKAMAPDKLAELWNLDPKRAKRILANRQSAARSKERKARYISELERKVQTLQTEATTLSAQFTLFQRDTTSLSAENTELKLRLQAMEHQAELRDALNEALKKEVERLKMATGEMITPTDSYNFGMHHVPFNQSSVFSQQSQPATGRNEGQHIQMSQFRQFQSSMGGQHQSLGTQSQSQALSDMFQQDPLGRMQGLDINGRGPHLVKSEGPSISASESNSTF